MDLRTRMPAISEAAVWDEARKIEITSQCLLLLPGSLPSLLPIPNLPERPMTCPQVHLTCPAADGVHLWQVRRAAGHSHQQLWRAWQQHTPYQATEALAGADCVSCHPEWDGAVISMVGCACAECCSSLGRRGVCVCSCPGRALSPGQYS